VGLSHRLFAEVTERDALALVIFWVLTSGIVIYEARLRR
jgi:hypothetical protein